MGVKPQVETEVLINLYEQTGSLQKAADAVLILYNVRMSRQAIHERIRRTERGAKLLEERRKEYWDSE